LCFSSWVGSKGETQKQKQNNGLYDFREALLQGLFFKFQTECP
jgi:hypothetical protein